MDFETPHESLVAALADGRFVIINKKFGQWVTERVLGKLQGLSQIAVEPSNETSMDVMEESPSPSRFEMRRLLMIANDTVYHAPFSSTSSEENCLNGGIEVDLPEIDPRFQFHVKSVKFCQQKEASVTTDGPASEIIYRRRLAVQIRKHWWLTHENE